MPKSHTLKVALVLIEETLGSSTADLYSQFYADKTEDLILKSLGQLLEEAVGPEFSKRKIMTLKKG